MTDIEAMVLEFHRVMGLGVSNRPKLPENSIRELRLKLLDEEYIKEYLPAEADNDLVEIADALADMVYVIFGTAIEYGIPLNEVITEVHRSNMTKVSPSGLVLRRQDGKVLKPETYSPPDIKGILESNI